MFYVIDNTMGVSWLNIFLVASVWCSSGIHCYSIHRIDNENGQPVNVEIEFFSNEDPTTFWDKLKQSSRGDNTMIQTNDHWEGTESTPGADNEAKRRMFLLFINNSNNFTGGNNDSTPLDSWSVVWYIASFGGLIVFFLIVSCSEWCCRRAIRNNNQNCARNTTAVPASPTVPDTPPPSYDQFAPPSYESIVLGRRGCEKSEYDIYVVPVHALGTIMESRSNEDAPPSYLSASTGRDFTARLESQTQSRVT